MLRRSLAKAEFKMRTVQVSNQNLVLRDQAKVVMVVLRNKDKLPRMEEMRKTKMCNNLNRRLN